MSERRTLRKTKIVATVGPACDDVETLTKMIEAGMNVARLNFSHEDHERHALRVERVRAAAAASSAHVGTMLDTKGAEIRTGSLVEEVVLENGAPFRLFADDALGDATGVSISYPNLVRELEPGHAVLIDDGRIELKVEALADGALECRVVRGGPLSNHKGINVPDKALLLDGLNEANQADLRFAVEHGIDYIAASFMQRADDVEAIRGFLEGLGGEHIRIIAKIENREGLQNLDAIVEAADGTMVARGDLGVEIGDGHGRKPSLGHLAASERRELRRVAHAPPGAGGRTGAELEHLERVAAAVLVDQLPTSNAQGRFVATRLFDVAAETIQLWSVAAGVAGIGRIGRHADAFEPIDATGRDLGHKCLQVKRSGSSRAGAGTAPTVARSTCP